jgi:hypothetical protein
MERGLDTMATDQLGLMVACNGVDDGLQPSEMGIS